MCESRKHDPAMTEFRFKMQQIGVRGIKEAILRTWDEPEGIIVREVGFDILEELLGEEAADQEYENIWEEAQRRKERLAW